MSGEPERRGDSIRVTVDVAAVAGQPASGRLLLSAPIGSAYRFGQLVLLRCQLEAPWEGADGFDYRRWLRRYGVTAVCARPQLLSSEPPPGPTVAGTLYSFKDRLSEVAGSAVPEPQASLLGGLLWGARQTLPADLVEAFRRAGLSHIVAVSGYNTSLVAGCLEALLLGVGLARRRALPLTLAALAAFVVLCGAGAAVLRAGLMGGAVLLARALGRPAAANRVLLLVAVGMVAANPFLLVADVGFQLSVAATWGMVNLGRPIQARLGWVPAKLGLREALASTLAATVATLPISLSQFGLLSAVAPLANVLVVPAIPLTMAVGAVAVGLGLAWLPLGQLAGVVAWLPLRYVAEVGERLGGLPAAAINLQPLGAWAWLLYLPLMLYLRRRHVPA